MRNSSHALIVGGTGMLRGVCERLAQHTGTVSVIARDLSRLKSLADSLSSLPGRLNPISVDYRDGAMLRSAIERATAEFGPIELVVAWVHSTAPDAPAIIARAAATHSRSLRFFHVLGSASADPSQENPSTPAWVIGMPNLEYRRVILGFVLESDDSSRWLTDAEICAGVLEAIQRDDEESIVGVVEPWSKRP